MRRIALLLCLAATVSACEAAPPDLAVDLRTDFAPLSEFVRVRTQRIGESGEVLDERSIVGDLDGDYLRGVRIAEFRDLPVGMHAVRVSLLDVDGALLLPPHNLQVDLQRSRVVTALVSRSCLGVACPDPDGDPALTECAGGVCVHPECTPENPEGCPTTGCTSDASCMPTVACAVGRCIDAACWSVDEGACGVGRWCNPDVGCEELMLPDTGPPEVDAGPSCRPRTCAALGYDCGAPTECGMTLACGACTAPEVCGGGGTAFQCGLSDTARPTASITSGPDPVTTDTSATFVFTGSDTGSGIAYYECSIDGASFRVCTSPESYASLAEGSHTFRVRAFDGAGNVSPPAMWTWIIDLTPPSVGIDPIPDPRPATYGATPSVAFGFTCSDSASSCTNGSQVCRVDGMIVACTWLSGSVNVGASGAFAFGDHTLSVTVEDAAGNTGMATRMFTVTRCANDMQFPNRLSNGLTRGDCCTGLVVANWQDFTGPWHPRGDASCRPMSDFTSRPYETIWGGGGCEGGLMTTTQWLQDAGQPGCSSAAGRAACVSSETQARVYCGTDTNSGTGQTPFHGRAGEGWHGSVAAGCEVGLMSTSALMQRYGADRVCFSSIDTATDRGSLRSTEACGAGLTRFCRTNPVDSVVGCVCATADPYAADGRS
jgi:hypothetical protein